MPREFIFMSILATNKQLVVFGQNIRCFMSIEIRKVN